VVQIVFCGEIEGGDECCREEVSFVVSQFKNAFYGQTKLGLRKD